MIRSMTGFGAAEGSVGGAVVAVEVRSVNHRFFNPSIKLPSEFARWEGEVRETLRKSITRGHVTLFARVAREQTEGRIDEARFASYVQQLRGLQQRYGLVAGSGAGRCGRNPLEGIRRSRLPSHDLQSGPTASHEQTPRPVRWRIRRR